MEIIAKGVKEMIERKINKAKLPSHFNPSNLIIFFFLPSLHLSVSLSKPSNLPNPFQSTQPPCPMHRPKLCIRLPSIQLLIPINRPRSNNKHTLEALIITALTNNRTTISTELDSELDAAIGLRKGVGFWCAGCQGEGVAGDEDVACVG